MNQIPSNARFLFQNLDAPRGQESRAAETTPWVTNHANRHAFLFRFLALNMGAFALLAAAWGQGWLQMVIEADSTGLTFIIVAVFAIGFILCGQRVWWLNGELALLAGAEAVPGSLVTDYLGKTAGHDSSSRQLSASAAKLRISAEISIVRHFANSLVLLGLIGTVVGFIIALSGVDANAVGDVKAISPMVSRLLTGMSVALYTTLVGAALNLWLSANHNLLSRAAAMLFARLIDIGEADAGTRALR